jgi:hypothetical protein
MGVVEWLMWSGLGVAFLGLTLTWTRNWHLELFVDEETLEEIGRWVMRLGATVMTVAAVVLLLGDG